MKLFTKLVLCVALCALFAAEGIVFLSRKAVHEALMSRLAKDAEGEVLKSSRALAAAMRTKEESRILPLLQAYLKATGADCAAALDGEGRIVSHSNVAEVGRVDRDADTLAALRSDSSSTLETRRHDKPILILSVPMFDEAESPEDEDFLLSPKGGAKRGARVGLLRVGLPLDSALATEALISGRIRLVVLGVSGAFGFLLLYYVRLLLAPIGLVSAATAKIRDGDYCSIIPVTTNDEIGALARSFNTMSRELGQTTISKDFLNEILNSIPDLVVVTDAAGKIVLVNPAVVRLLGWSREELVGRPAAVLLDGEEASFLTPMQNISASLVAKSRDKVSVLFTSAAITAADGRITGYIGAAKDVSELRRLEARMRQSEKLSAVGQLAAGVAHEINNPLGVILGFAQTMARGLKAEDELELPIRSIEREALRCKVLVQSLLTFARTSHSERIAMDVNSAVEQALALIAPHAKLGRVAVATELAAGLPSVLGNKNQLEQVIMNLAKNAIDAMPDGGTLTLSTELLEQAPHSWVCLRFVDDGTGIPPAVASKIFDPFFTTKPIGQGTGLGLSLVSEIVQKHSGEISVESRPGRTEFAVKLPPRTGQELDRRIETPRRDKAEELAARPEAKGRISHG